MLISVDRAEFLAAIKRATAIAPPDSPLDVLKGVLLETDSTRKMLTVTSTNLEVSLVEMLPCSAQEDGALVYSARTLAEMLQRLPEDTVEISRKENRGRMTLTSGSASYEVDVWDRGAFPKPDLPFPEDTVKVSGIPAMAQHTVFATAQDKDKPLLRCVNLMFTSTGLRAAGSNGMCIVTAKGDDQSTGDISLLVPALSLGKLAGMCKDEDEFRVGTTGKSIVFFKENFLFSARLIEGGYIDTDSLLKTITNSFTVLTDTKEMREALSSVLSVALDGRVNLAFEDQKLVFHCSSDWGNASAGIDVIALTGAPTGSYWYSAKQLATCLKALGGTITLGIAQSGMLTISTQDAYYPIAQAKAWLSGHDKVESSDLLALKDYLWRLPADREKVESVLNRFCINPMQEKVNDVREMALDSQAGFEEACGDGSREDLARKAFIKLRGELVRLYQKQCELRTSAQSDSETALMDGLLNDLEDISRRAHEKTGFTYTPLSEIAALN